MKNIHILPTDKPSRLSINTCFDNILELWDEIDVPKIKQDSCIQDYNIYITSDEIVTEYSKGLYFIDIYTNTRHIFSPIYINEDTIALGKFHAYMNNGNMCKKIILTTDPDLIKNGVQAIDDEFLEWFVKNPSCEWVDVKDNYVCSNCNEDRNNPKYQTCHGNYRTHKTFKIIIPKEEKALHDYGWCKTNVILPKEEPKTTGNIEVDYTLGKSKVIQESMRLDAETAYRYLSKQGTHICKYCKAETTQSDEECYAKPKQETIEEVAKDFVENTMKYSLTSMDTRTVANRLLKCVEFGAKWQAERMYSDEEVYNLLYKLLPDKEELDGWFEQFKKK